MTLPSSSGLVLSEAIYYIDNQILVANDLKKLKVTIELLEILAWLTGDQGVQLPYSWIANYISDFSSLGFLLLTH